MEPMDAPMDQMNETPVKTNEPKPTIVIMLRVGQFSTKQK